MKRKAICPVCGKEFEADRITQKYCSNYCRRYYQAMIDMDMLKKGEVYNQLRPSYIIFICTFDAFDEGLPMYTFRNRCVEKDGLELGDEATKIS